MKLLRSLFCIAMFLLIAVPAIFADDEKQDAKGESVIIWKNQTVCPVMGQKIDSTSYTNIQGQRVYNCCDMCTKKLNDDPDKYFKDASEAGIMFENIQARCPVSGEELQNKGSFLVYEGRRVFFCSNKCQESFLEEPQKYLTILDEFTAEEKENAKVKYRGKAHRN